MLFIGEFRAGGERKRGGGGHADLMSLCGANGGASLSLCCHNPCTAINTAPLTQEATDHGRLIQTRPVAGYP